MSCLTSNASCYNQNIKRSEEIELNIYHAIKRDALLENATVMADSTIDFNDSSETKNIYFSYPLYHIQNTIKLVSKTYHAAKVIFLTANAFSGLLVEARLTADQIQYHFLSSFTSTERSATELTPTFSAYFGATCLSLYSTRYTEMLVKHIQAAGTQAYLLITSWNGTDKRISIKDTRSIIDAILNGEINKVETITLLIFNLFMLAARLT